MGQNPFSVATMSGHARHQERTIARCLCWLERSNLLRGRSKGRSLTPLGAIVLRREFERALGAPAHRCISCGRQGLTDADMIGKRGRVIRRCQTCQERYR
jgi:hypothetical protein